MNQNLLTAALGVSALQSAIEAMLTQRDSENNDLDIRPQVLVVAPENQVTAQAALESEFLEQTVAGTPTANALRRAVKLEVEPRISNTTKFTNTAAANWYLFGSQQDAALIVAFLNGQQRPTIEFFGLDHDVGMLGVAWRVYIDAGAALADYRAAVKSTGAGE